MQPVISAAASAKPVQWLGTGKASGCAQHTTSQGIHRTMQRMCRIIQCLRGRNRLEGIDSGSQQTTLELLVYWHSVRLMAQVQCQAPEFQAVVFQAI